jgi:autotransporter-associated beta strand protein
MQLPGGLLHGQRAATFDFWAAYDPIAGNNDRVFDFGNTNGVAGGVGGQPNNYLYFSPHAGTVHRLTGTGSTSEFEQTASASGVLDGQTVHITCVVNPPDHYLAIYTNGVLEVANTNFTIPFASLDDQVAYLGRSLWADLNGDAYLSGSIDEFRIYNGALSAVSVRQSHLLGPDALLSDGPVQLIAQPADTTIPQGLPVTFSGVAIGRSPISYQWFENGAPIPAATNSSYSFIAAFSQNNHTFQLVATNNVDGVDYAAASTNATLTVVIPPTLVWLGANGNLWDTASLNWTNPGAGSLVAYGQFDGALFDDRGSAQPNVDLQQTVTPLSLQVNSTANYTLYSSALNGSLAGSGVLNKNGSGTFVLDVSNNLTGPVTISGGTLQVGNYDSYGSLGSGVVTNNATLSFLRGDTALVVPNVIHGSGTVSFDGPGSVTIAGTNDYTGSTLINSGVLNLQNSSGLGATGAGTTVAYGGQLYVTANVNGAEPLTLNGAGDGNGALRKGGAGATVWTGAINLAGDATIGVDGSATLTLSNTVSGNAALTAAGNGTLALNVANTYTGGTTLAGPVVNVNAAGALGNGLITVNGNGRFVLASGLTLANPVMANIVSPGVATGLLMVNDNTNGTVTTISGALTFNASAANGGNFFGPTSSGYLNVTAPITNNATGVVSSRNGFVRLSGGGDYTSFILNQGTLSLGANNGLCPNAALTIANSGSATFDLNGFNQTLTGLADGATNPELVTNSAAALSTLTLNLSFGSTYSGALAGNLALVVNGSASLNLTGTNAYTGNTTVNGGLLEIARPTLSARSTVTVANGALLQLDFLETNTVAGLVLNGVSQPPGVYNSATSPSYLTGVGSLLVSAVAMNPTNITATVSGGNLVLSWPADHTGWRLQAQTNSLATGLGTNWVDVPNSTGVNAVTNAINPINGAVFYRLVSP